MNALHSCAVLLLFAGGVLSSREDVACEPYQHPEALDHWSVSESVGIPLPYDWSVSASGGIPLPYDWSVSESGGKPLPYETVGERLQPMHLFKLTMWSHAKEIMENEVPTAGLWELENEEDDCHWTFTFREEFDVRKICADQIVASDFKTFFLGSRCDSENNETHVYLFTKEGTYTRNMKSEIIRSSWRRNWTDDFQARVEGMKEVEDGGNQNTCFNMKPMKGVESHKFDGRWLTAKGMGPDHVPSCVALQPRHAADIQHVDVGVYNGTTSKLLHTSRAQTLEPGKCFGENLFKPGPDMSVVHTHLYSDRAYGRWALYHQCATVTLPNGRVQDQDLALVLYKDGAIGRPDLEQEIEMVLKSHRWPKDFKKLVRNTKYVAGEKQLCRDEALQFCGTHFTPAQLTNSYINETQKSVPDTWYSKWN